MVLVRRGSGPCPPWLDWRPVGAQKVSGARAENHANSPHSSRHRDRSSSGKSAKVACTSSRNHSTSAPAPPAWAWAPGTAGGAPAASGPAAGTGRRRRGTATCARRPPPARRRAPRTRGRAPAPAASARAPRRARTRTATPRTPRGTGLKRVRTALPAGVLGAIRRSRPRRYWLYARNSAVDGVAQEEQQLRLRRGAVQVLERQRVGHVRRAPLARDTPWRRRKAAPVAVEVLFGWLTPAEVGERVELLVPEPVREHRWVLADHLGPPRRTSFAPPQRTRSGAARHATPRRYGRSSSSRMGPARRGGRGEGSGEGADIRHSLPRRRAELTPRGRSRRTRARPHPAAPSAPPRRAPR
jgi:hypothetical protein